MHYHTYAPHYLKKKKLLSTACGVVPAGPIDVNASSLMTPDIHALWCGLACLAFGDITNKVFYWPECISYLPPFVPSSLDENKAVKLMDEPLKLIHHPWRYAFALWERARRQPSVSGPNSVVEYGLGVVSLI
jgi:hypothetical protein